jgi:uncharacterized repeat protein (TIGR01451 family)
VVISAGPLVIAKTSDVTAVAAGGAVRYSITVTNTGQTTFTGITLADPLSGVLDDAAYNADATATTGTVSFASGTVTWTGNLGAGATATISYSVTVAIPDAGDMMLTNSVTSSTLGANCASGSPDTRCTATVPVAALTIVKSADATAAAPRRPGPLRRFGHQQRSRPLHGSDAHRRARRCPR